MRVSAKRPHSCVRLSLGAICFRLVGLPRPARSQPAERQASLLKLKGASQLHAHAHNNQTVWAPFGRPTPTSQGRPAWSETNQFAALVLAGAARWAASTSLPPRRRRAHSRSMGNIGRRKWRRRPSQNELCASSENDS